MECQINAKFVRYCIKSTLKSNDESRGTYNANSQINFKTAMLSLACVLHISLLKEK